MLGYQRRARIRELIASRHEATVAELCTLLAASPSTIRRDLERLAEEGLVVRRHGGAVAAASTQAAPEPPVRQRALQQAAEKRAIGLAAAGLVRDGDVIGIESGSTSLELACALAAHTWQCLHVVTNSFPVVSELLRTPGVHLVFVGGSVNPDELGTFGSMAEEALCRLNIDRLFMTCRCIDPRLGLCNDPQAEGTFATERALVRASRQVIVLADHTKFGHAFPLQSVPVEALHTVVTDAQAPEALVRALRGRGLQVVVASTSEVAP
jgi:DeoR/GlpR family transcriptional regulator of sugar metabolism